MQEMRQRNRGGVGGLGKAAAGLRRKVQAVANGQEMERRSSLEEAEQMQVVIVVTRIITIVSPFVDWTYNALIRLWDLMEENHAQDLLVAMYGFALCFFGGVFMTVVAAAEAAHLFGWEKISFALHKLHCEWRTARIAFERDNCRDDDNDGVRDVDRMDARQLASRRLLVLCKSVDPEALSIGLEGLSCASVAILATLRVRFAAAITLGTGIGDVVLSMFGPAATAAMTAIVPDDYDRWVPVLCRYTARYIGVTLSWMLMRVTSSVFSSMRGSSILITGICAYLVRHEHIDRHSVKNGEPGLVLAWGVIALLGFYWQASSGYSLRFPWNIVLLPVTILEKFLVGVVGSKTV